MTAQIIRLKIASPKLKLKAAVRLSGLVSASSPITVSYAGTTIRVGLDLPTLETSLDARYAGFGNIRERLVANRTYFVAAAGNDNNNGLAAGTAFLTVQKAIDTIANTLDLQGFAVTISVLAGTYTANMVAATSWVGGKGTATTPPVTISGASAATVTLTSASGTTLAVGSFNGPPVALGIQGVTISASGGTSIQASDGSAITITGDMTFGAATASHINLTRRANLRIQSSYHISGNAGVAHIAMTQNSTMVVVNANTITLSSGALVFGTGTGNTGFIFMSRCSTASIASGGYAPSTTSATGQRYAVSLNSVLDSSGTIFPGNAAGVTPTGGQYA